MSGSQAEIIQIGGTDTLDKLGAPLLHEGPGPGATTVFLGSTAVGPALPSGVNWGFTVDLPIQSGYNITVVDFKGNNHPDVSCR